MKWRAIILDDSEKDIILLEMELKSFPVKVEKRFTDPFKFIDEESQLKYDVLFLDMNMPGLNGSDIVSRINKPVILVTGESKEYAESINDLKLDHKHFVCALNKPINSNRITKALELLKEKIKPLSYLQLNTKKGKMVLDVSEIELITSQDLDRDCESQGEGKIVYRKGKEPLHISTLNMDQVFGKLDSSKFIQSSRFDIINVHCIEGVTHDTLKVRYTDKSCKSKETERPLNKQGKLQYREIFG